MVAAHKSTGDGDGDGESPEPPSPELTPPELTSPEPGEDGASPEPTLPEPTSPELTSPEPEPISPEPEPDGVLVIVASTMTLPAVTAMATWHSGASQRRKLRRPASYAAVSKLLTSPATVTVILMTLSPEPRLTVAIDVTVTPRAAERSAGDFVISDSALAELAGGGLSMGGGGLGGGIGGMGAGGEGEESGRGLAEGTGVASGEATGEA